MRKTFFVTLAAAALAATASAQIPATLRLSVDEAVSMALEHNVDLNADRLDPQISDTRVAAAAGVFKPTLNTAVNSNNQLVPPSNFLIPTATRGNVDARRSARDLAQELVRVNKAKVDVGTSPPLDLVSAQAEVAADQEQLIIAETSVKQAEDRLRMLILDPTQRDNWNVAIEAI